MTLVTFLPRLKICIKNLPISLILKPCLEVALVIFAPDCRPCLLYSTYKKYKWIQTKGCHITALLSSKKHMELWLGSDFYNTNVPSVFPSHVTPNQCPKAGKMVREAFTANLFLCPLPISSYKRLQQHEFWTHHQWWSYHSLYWCLSW